MKIKMIAIFFLFLSGCANLQSPKETNIAVSALLDEIQIAVNEISTKADGSSSLPPFKNAEVKLATVNKKTTDGGASMVLSGKVSKSAKNSSLITLILVPNNVINQSAQKSTGQKLADYVIAAVTAVDEKKFLKLSSLTVEAGLEVVRSASGGIEVELIGVTFGASQAEELTSSNSLKLVFAVQE